jgi:hypothetical protein
MADAIGWARTTITDAFPSMAEIKGGLTADGGLIRNLTLPSVPSLGLAGTGSSTSASAPLPAGPIDPDLDREFADRRARVAALRSEGPRALGAGQYRRAAELCSAWTDLELASAEAWRCYGLAQQAQGYHQDAINAFRKAKQYDPSDRTLDAAIDRSQKGIVADFLARYRRQ